VVVEVITLLALAVLAGVVVGYLALVQAYLELQTLAAVVEVLAPLVALVAPALSLLDMHFKEITWHILQK
jgi:hypothetical protein